MSRYHDLPRSYVARKAEEQAVTDFIRQETPNPDGILVLTGVSGAGKTRLVRFLETHPDVAPQAAYMRLDAAEKIDWSSILTGFRDKLLKDRPDLADRQYFAGFDGLASLHQTPSQWLDGWLKARGYSTLLITGGLFVALVVLQLIVVNFAPILGQWWNILVSSTVIAGGFGGWQWLKRFRLPSNQRATCYLRCGIDPATLHDATEQQMQDYYLATFRYAIDAMVHAGGRPITLIFDLERLPSEAGRSALMAGVLSLIGPPAMPRPLQAIILTVHRNLPDLNDPGMRRSLREPMVVHFLAHGEAAALAEQALRELDKHVPVRSELFGLVIKELEQECERTAEQRVMRNSPAAATAQMLMNGPGEQNLPLARTIGLRCDVFARMCRDGELDELSTRRLTALLGPALADPAQDIRNRHRDRPETPRDRKLWKTANLIAALGEVSDEEMTPLHGHEDYMNLDQFRAAGVYVSGESAGKLTLDAGWARVLQLKHQHLDDCADGLELLFEDAMETLGWTVSGWQDRSDDWQDPRGTLMTDMAGKIELVIKCLALPATNNAFQKAPWDDRALVRLLGFLCKQAEAGPARPEDGALLTRAGDMAITAIAAVPDRSSESWRTLTSPVGPALVGLMRGRLEGLLDNPLALPLEIIDRIRSAAINLRDFARHGSTDVDAGFKAEARALAALATDLISRHEIAMLRIAPRETSKPGRRPINLFKVAYRWLRRAGRPLARTPETPMERLEEVQAAYQWLKSSGIQADTRASPEAMTGQWRRYAGEACLEFGLEECIAYLGVLRKFANSMASRLAAQEKTTGECEAPLFEFERLVARTLERDGMEDEARALLQSYVAAAGVYWIGGTTRQGVRASDRFVDIWQGYFERASNAIDLLPAEDRNRLIAEGIAALDRRDLEEIGEPDVLRQAYDRRLAAGDMQLTSHVLSELDQRMRASDRERDDERCNSLLRQYFSLMDIAGGQTRDRLALIRILLRGIGATLGRPLDEDATARASQLRRQYAEAVAEHLAGIRPKPVQEASEETKALRTKLLADYANDIKGEAVGQALLNYLAAFNPQAGEVRAGDFIVARVESLAPALRISAPYSDAKINIQGNLVAPVLHFDAIGAQRPGADDRSRRDWVGQLLLVNALSPQPDAAAHPVTCRGPEYLARCMHLLFPTENSWSDAVRARMAQGSGGRHVWIGNLWTAASNSCLTLRVPAAAKTALLVNGGRLHQELERLFGIRRFVIFVARRSESQVDIESELRHMINDTYSKLDVNFGDGGEVVLHFNPERGAKDKPFDERHAMTTLSLLRKIYRVPARISGFDDAAYLVRRALDEPAEALAD